MIDYTKMKKKWPHLNALKDAIESNENSKEKIIKFYGYKLVTNKFEYGLFDGKLSRTKR